MKAFLHRVLMRVLPAPAVAGLRSVYRQTRRRLKQLVEPPLPVQIAALVHRILPPIIGLVVVNQGKDDLLRLGFRRTWPFPPKESTNGTSAADDASLIAHLEVLRAQGADYLLVPRPAVAWLDRHPEFRGYLEERYGGLRDEEPCLIFDLHDKPVPADLERQRQEAARYRAYLDNTLPPAAKVIVLSQGDPALLRLGGRRVWDFPAGPDGRFAGFAIDGPAAIAALEQLRAQGAEYLVVPTPAHWWLEHYPDFGAHVHSAYRLTHHDPALCRVFSFQPFRKRPPSPRPFGVNVAGSIRSEKGIGEGVRADIHSLAAAGVPYVLNHFAEPDSANPDNTFAQLAEENPYRFNLIHVNADAVSEFVCAKGEGFFHERYNIGFWAWELQTFPRRWQSSFQYFDELWVPSRFVQEALARVAPVPVRRMPHALRENLPVLPRDRSAFGLPPGAFVFLFIFDFHSVVERKHPRGLIQAFRKAFPAGEDALLVLKGSHAGPGEVEALQEAAAGANVRVVDNVLSREEVNTLIQLSDCYVSLHRSEGFGLTLAEAMSLEKPVIATAYSGNMDFMTPANSFLVRYTLTELEKAYGPYPKGAVWAEPDLDHAAALMRRVYEDRTAAQEVGRQARQEVLRLLHPCVVGTLMKDRLLEIGA